MSSNQIRGITNTEYDKKVYELKQRQIELDGLLHAHTLADEDFTITLNCLMDIASKAYELFESSKVEQKRHLINFVLTNLQLKGKKLMFTVKKPFDLFLNLDDGYEWRREELKI